MTTADFRERGLDPAHILSVTNQATSSGRGRAAHAVAAPGGVRVCLPSRRAAGDATAALARVGYQAGRIDGSGHRGVLVTGWSAAGLESRLAAMRVVLHQLDASPLATAAGVIERIRRRPAVPPASPDTRVLAEAGAQLRAWVSARSGIHAPHVSAIVPGDRGNALRLRTAWTLETAIDHLIERHLRVAGHALSLFGSLRQHTTDDQAQQIAIRRAGLTIHPDAQLAQDSSALIRRAAQPPGPGPRFSGPERPGPPPVGPPPAGPARGGPARQAASGFPQPVTTVITAADVTAALAARRGGRSFPAGRPGPRR